MYPSYVHYFSATLCPIYKKDEIKRENCGGNGNPSVNKENSSCRFFHVLIGASQGVPPPPLFLFFLFLFCFISFSLFLFSFFSSWREKGGRRGTQRQFEHRHSVYIYQNFFAFDRAIAIKMCSCNCRGLSSVFFLAEFATLTLHNHSGF